MTNWIRYTLMCGLLAASGAAHAGFILSNPGVPATAIDSNNDFATELAALGVTSFKLNSSLQLTAPSILTFDLFGSEAGYDNVLVVGGSGVLSTVGVAREVWGKVQSVSYTAAAGTVDFTFCALNIFTCLSNANNPFSTGFQSIGMWIDPDDSSTAWLLWDDSGAGPDDNHDDMVVRVRAVAVPEPSAWMLLAIAAASFALFRLRDRFMRRRQTIELKPGQLSRRFR